jgi:glycosyltransferase involved in cell wall biosynthesis
MSWRVLLGLNKVFFALCTKWIMVMSDDIAIQVRQLIAGREIPITTFLPVYSRDQFSMFRPPEFNARPFNIFFAGRIETNKGVYDLLSMAQWLEQYEPHAFHFNICGEGSELEPLRERIQQIGLTASVTCYGFCERSKITEILNKCSVVIVPTRTDFEEGFNMVCAEAILAGRPLITSSVCPALNYVRDAAIEVTPNNVQEYSQAILKLARDRALFESKRLACKSVEEQFYDQRNCWGAKLTAAIKSLPV